MTNCYGNLFDYITWRGDLSFEQSPINVVDSLIFSVFAYIVFPGCEGAEVKTLGDAIAGTLTLPPQDRTRVLDMMSENSVRLAQRAAESERFRDVRICQYVDMLCEQSEKQFAAMTFLLPDGSVFIGYRGTDNSLVGWKEDVNMSFLNGTPAQREAAVYAENIANRYDGIIRLGGHSKGGNLAVWAAANLPEDVVRRIAQVFSHDGPGFTEEFIASESYDRLTGKVFSFVPESSVVGVLMAHCDYLTIKSTNHSVMQHDPFSWQIIGKRFVYDLERTKSGRTLERAVNGFISGMNAEEKEQYVEKIYSILRSTKVRTLHDLEKNMVQNVFFTLPKIIRETAAFAIRPDQAEKKMD